jgi:ribosomal protein L4
MDESCEAIQTYGRRRCVQRAVVVQLARRIIVNGATSGGGAVQRDRSWAWPVGGSARDEKKRMIKKRMAGRRIY